MRTPHDKKRTRPVKRTFARVSVSLLVPMVVFAFALSAQYATPLGKMVRDLVANATVSAADIAFSYASRTMGPLGMKQGLAPTSASRVLASVGVMTADRIIRNVEDIAFAGDSVGSFYAYLNRNAPGRDVPERLAVAAGYAVRPLATTADAFAASSAAINGTTASILDTIGGAMKSAAHSARSFLAGSSAADGIPTTTPEPVPTFVIIEFSPTVSPTPTENVPVL